MKRKNKLLLGSFLLLGGSLLLTGCTQPFYTNEDQAKMLYSFDYGATRFFDSENDKDNYLVYLGSNVNKFESTVSFSGQTIYTVTAYKNSPNLDSYISMAKEQGISIPSNEYYYLFDTLVLEESTNLKNTDTLDINTYFDLRKVNDINTYTLKSEYGHLKFSKGGSSFDGVSHYNNLIKDYVLANKTIESTSIIDSSVVSSIKLDNCMSNDFYNLYKSNLSSLTATSRSVFTIYEGYYGDYNGYPIKIEKKTYKDAWSKGFFEGLLVYPIGALVDIFAHGFSRGNLTLESGVPQFLSILLVTVIVRGLMLLVTFKQTSSSSKMQALQPQIAKIQAKYPNSNTNQYDKQRLAQETADLYKKNGINPLTSLLVLIVQFPVFICVWGALQDSAVLSTGSFLGLKLSSSLSSVLFNKASWQAGGGAITALVLFLLMSAAQTVSMLLPQWIQKKQRKNVVKLGRNPAQKEQDSKTKWFTYIMLVMIIIMGFSLVSALGVYWLVGALVSIAQTLITNKVMAKKQKNY